MVLQRLGDFWMARCALERHVLQQCAMPVSPYPSGATQPEPSGSLLPWIAMGPGKSKNSKAIIQIIFADAFDGCDQLGRIAGGGRIGRVISSADASGPNRRRKPRYRRQVKKQK